jgi:hypothetical protein
MVGLSIIITIIQKNISLILTWYQSKTNNQQPSIVQQPSSPAAFHRPAAFFPSSLLRLLLDFSLTSGSSPA